MTADLIIKKRKCLYDLQDSVLKSGMWQLQGKSFIAFPLQLFILG